jgi:hypothetical protein
MARARPKTTVVNHCARIVAVGATACRLGVPDAEGYRAGCWTVKVLLHLQSCRRSFRALPS